MKKKKILYYIFIIILFILGGLCSFFAYYFYYLEEGNIQTKELIINEKANLEYNVKLKDNKYYEDLEKQENFITNLMDNVSTHYTYTSSFSNPVNGYYSYYIIGNLVIKDKNNEIISKEIERTNADKYEINKNVINISSDFNIDIKKQLAYYEEFKKDILASSSNINAYIEYKVFINYDVFSEHINKNLVDETVLYIKVPISDEITKIDSSKVLTTEQKRLSNNNKENRTILTAISLEFLGSSLLFFLIIVSLIQELLKKDPFEVYLKKILRKYGNIVKISEVPNLEKYEVLYVNSLEELMDVSLNLNIMVNYCEIVKNSKVIFILINQNSAYIYKLMKKNIKINH